jgi:hypothetical protein
MTKLSGSTMCHRTDWLRLYVHRCLTMSRVCWSSMGPKTHCQVAATYLPSTPSRNSPPTSSSPPTAPAGRHPRLRRPLLDAFIHHSVGTTFQLAKVDQAETADVEPAGPIWHTEASDCLLSRTHAQRRRVPEVPVGDTIYRPHRMTEASAAQ